MKKRIIAFLLIACLMTALFAGCGSKTETAAETTESAAADTTKAEATEETPVAEDETAEAAELPVYELPFTTEDITFTYWCMGGSPTVNATLGVDNSYNTSDATLALQEMLGITVKYVEADMMTASEKFNIMIASGEFCDIMSGFDGNYSGGASVGYEDEVIIELSDLIADMPYYSDYLSSHPDFEKLTLNDDGQSLYIASFCDENYAEQGGCIRQDWLDKLGLDMPKTYDELTEVAVAFKNEYDCSATIYLTNEFNPMSCFSAGFDLPGFSFASTGAGFYQIDDEIQYTYIRDEFKEMLELYKQWYSLGVISPDFILSQGGGDAQTIINMGESGICWQRAETINDSNLSLGDTGFNLAGFGTLVREEGQVIHFSPAQAGIYASVSISTSCENLDMLAKLLDFGFTPEGILWGNFGMENLSYTIGENGEAEYIPELFDGVSFKIATERYIRYDLPTIVDVDRAFAVVYDENTNAAIDLWNSNFDGAYDMASGLSFTQDESEERSAKLTDIETYVQQWAMKAVTGEADIDAEWDDYVANLYSLGLQECIDIQQDSYDRFISR